MSYTLADIERVKLVVGLEVHVELATRTKMFSRAPNPAHPEFDPHASGHERAGPGPNTPGPNTPGPNTWIDPTVLGLPGALPVLNRAAIETSMMVGLALGCEIAQTTKWDRKSYFYPDLPKAYQISQYDLPLCFDGSLDVPAVDAKGQIDFEQPPTRIGIVRAHLEEDAGKLLHELPGGGALDATIADYNRAGTPLLEIVTQPDFTTADQVVTFCRMLRNICRFLGASEGVMQKGHIRFEPNINTHLTLRDGHVVRTPIVEVKNLNSFKSVKSAIEYEAAQQPARWLRDGRVFGPGTKQTRGWNEHAAPEAGPGRGATVLQREKEDAHDYRYFPDPDLPPVRIDEAWKAGVRERIPELPLARFRRYMDEFGLGPKEAAALIDERDVCFFFERSLSCMEALGLSHARAGKLAANLLLQSGAKRANELQREVHELGAQAEDIAALGVLREQGKLNNQNVDELFGVLCESPTGLRQPGESLARVEEMAAQRGMLVVRDEGAMNAWIDAALAEQAQAAADVRAGKQAAIGRLVGAAMKHAGGKADAKALREAILARLSG